jgi:peptidyl-prolyl cis-trans isomerase B (cyclophilin B)
MTAKGRATVTSSKRRREVARAKAERQATRRADAAQRRATRNRIIAVVAVVVVVGGVLAWALLNRSSDSSDVAAPAESAIPTESAAPDASASADTSASPEASASPEPSATSTTQPDASCAPAPEPRPDDLTWPKAPEDAVKPDTAYTMTLATNCGDIVIDTLPAEAPATVASMAFLTEEGYFDLTACHRLTTEGIFVLQCGDPAGNGTGGPGYSIPDENLPAEGAANYPAGTVAMANAGPGTGGSQFFIVYEDTTLPSGYTIWGTVSKGLDVVQGIAAAGVEGGGTDGPPAQRVVIEKATLTTSPAN